MKKDCNHRRIKREFPFGKKSTPRLSCKDCGSVVTRWLLSKLRRNKRGKRNVRK